MSLDNPKSEGNFALLQAARACFSPEVIPALVSGGADVNTRRGDGLTPLMVGAAYHEASVVAALLGAGADPLLEDFGGHRALAFAVAHNSVDVVELVLEAEAKAQGLSSGEMELSYLLPIVMQDLESQPDDWGRGSHEEEVLLFLIERGADPVAAWPRLGAALTGRVPASVLALLIERGLDVGEEMPRREAFGGAAGGTVNMALLAAEMSSAESLSLLVRAGASVRCVDNTGRSVLHHAVRRLADPELVRQLVSAGAEVNAVDAQGETPLICAARSADHPQLVEALLHAGADVHICDNHGRRAVDYASDNEALKLPGILRALSAS